MNARQKSYELYLKALTRLDLPAGTNHIKNQIASLRKDEMVLHKWFEHECNGDIERDEETGKPFRVWTDSKWNRHKYPTADREKGALKRIDIVCKSLGLHYYIQQDPRGCALYVSKTPINATNYTNGFAVCD